MLRTPFKIIGRFAIRHRFLFGVLLFCAANHFFDGGPFDLVMTVKGQAAGFTTVTGTITDPNGLKYSCGTITAQLITAGGAAPTLNGGGFTTVTSPARLGCPTTPGTGAPGSFLMQLADSGVIVPSNTTWRFTINLAPGIAPPAGTGPQSFSVTTAINCATNTPATCTSNAMDISTLLSASAPAISNGGGNGVGSGASPIPNLFFGNRCPTANTAQCVFANGNGFIDNTATWSSVSTTLTAADGPFTPGNVGMQLWGWGASGTGISGCNPFQAQPVASILTTTHLTISAFISPTQVTLSGTPGSTFSVAGAGCILVASSDDANAAALWTIVNASQICPKVSLINSYYGMMSPWQILWGQPSGCANLPNLYPNGTGANFGNVYMSSAFEVQGPGIGPALLLVPPDYPQTGSCTNNLSSSLAVPVGGMFHNIGFTSGGTGGTGICANFLGIGVGTLDHVTLTGIRAGNCLAINSQAQIQQVNISSCGTKNADVLPSTGNLFSPSWPLAMAYRLILEQANGGSDNNLTIEAGANFVCFSCRTLGTQSTAGIAQIKNHGGTLRLIDYVGAQQSNGIATITGTTVYNCDTAGGVLYAEDSTFGAGVATTTNGIFNSAACDQYLHNVKMYGTGAGFALTDVAGSRTFDLGGNQQIGTTTTLLGSVFGNDSITGTVPATGNFALTNATFTSVAGKDQRHFTLTVTASASAAVTVAYTFPIAFWQAPGSCHAQQTGGTNPILTWSTSVAPTTTAVTFLSTTAATNTDTIILALDCT